ncbi:GNAT family N-acetyltransferase [Leptothoe sp. PORK10 BA2]|uniref:GNAT family N-acetyltransferase n=1 Tax=Leptothoe sp. PORK10 BA2 TaxID=3110254 RepID=UPI002B21DDEC|nr:GNAT family N-acetyltransferase [Leptothoe sp. PORK10 BA2]MEA5464539.1 GNAT family N-acetyltransferase [Leptothoe sp. PORK10 BA2]
MIRPSKSEDTVALIALAEATGLFPPDGLELLRQMLTETFESSKDNDSFWLTDNDDGPVGVAYCEPERMADGTWNLQMILIHPDRQEQGRGTRLLQFVEQEVTARSGRMLIIDTSGVPEFERTRAFYAKCGYEAEARIRDFYAVGDDKVVFRKVLTGA